MTAPDGEEDELTALEDADFPRIDLVGKGANGIPRFLIAKQDNGAGLLEPDFVRDLIAKAEPEAPGREQVAMPPGLTLTGSPADIAAFIHKAAQRAEDPADVAKAKLSSAELNDLPDSAFAYIESGGKKDDQGKTTPRSLRHFAVHDKAHADNAAARIAQGAKFGKEAEPKVKAAQRKFGEKVSKEEAAVADPQAVAKDAGDVLDAQLDDGTDGMDPTVPLAAPDEDAPGDPTDPGSPAWEAIDAATACKWTSILSRARVAIDLLGEREMLEAASADPDDMDNAWDMQDVCCAIDYAISVLAPYAVAEQSEADTGTDAMAAIGKAMAGFDAVPMDRIEALSAVAKAGRVLSAKNESEIRSAAASLQNVLTSLPAAPMADDSGQPVAKQKEAAMAADQTAPAAAEDAPVQKADSGDQARDTGPVNTGGTTGLGQPRVTGPDGALPADGPQASKPGDVPGRQVIKSSIAAVFDQAGQLVGVTDPASIVQRVEKADGEEKPPMQAVFDQNGDLIGIVDPAAIQPVTGAGKPKPDDPAAAGEPKDGEPAAEPKADAPAAADMTPAPPADAGTPADGSGDDDDVAKQAGGDKDDTAGVAEVLKSIVAEAVSAAFEGRAPAEDIARQADVAGLGTRLEDALARIAKMEELPAPPKVFTNGQVPPASQLRGQDQGAARVDVAKAQEVRTAFRNAEPAEQNRIANQMQQTAISALDVIHGRQPAT